MEEENFYEARLDRIFAKGTMWQHRTLRTVFDPYSSEWNGTDFEKKFEILEKVIAAGEDLEGLIMEYKLRYSGQGRKDIANSVEDV